MFETVTADQLSRMLPRARPEAIAKVSAFVARPEIDKTLHEVIESCACIAGAAYCTCGSSTAPEGKTASMTLSTLAATYKLGAPRISRNGTSA